MRKRILLIQPMEHMYFSSATWFIVNPSAEIVEWKSHGYFFVQVVRAAGGWRSRLKSEMEKLKAAQDEVFLESDS